MIYDFNNKAKMLKIIIFSDSHKHFEKAIEEYEKRL
jgi:hypothetical protein